MIDGIVKGVTHLAGKFIEDADKRAEFEHELDTLAHKERLADKQINQAEASHPSIFVAGWRPALGWACSIILIYAIIVRDLLLLYTDVNPPEVAGVNLDVVVTVLGVLLGANIMGRTFEKVKRVARENLKS